MNVKDYKKREKELLHGKMEIECEEEYGKYC